MAEAFHLEVEDWDSEASLQDSASESCAPGDGPSASKRRRLSLSQTRKRARFTATALPSAPLICQCLYIKKFTPNPNRS